MMATSTPVRALWVRCAAVWTITPPSTAHMLRSSSLQLRNIALCTPRITNLQQHFILLPMLPQQNQGNHETVTFQGRRPLSMRSAGNDMCVTALAIFAFCAIVLPLTVRLLNRKLRSWEQREEH